MSSTGRLRALVGVLLLIVLALALVIQGLAGGAQPHARSARSKEPTGRLAAALLLDELGFGARRFEVAPIALPEPPALLWMPGAPQLPEHLLVGLEAAAGPALDDPRHGLFYRRFVEEGGTLVIPVEAASRPFLERVLGIEDPPLGMRTAASTEASTEASTAHEPALVRLRGEHPARIAFVERFARGGEPLRAHLLGRGPEPLVVDEAGLVVALRIPQGAGAVVLLATDSFLTNEGLAQAEHALLFVRLVELLGTAGRPLHFDEFALGDWRPAGKLELALAPGARGLTLHLSLLALVWIWVHAWAREFPRDPAPLAQRSPLERARAQAGLLLRASQHEFLAQRLRSGVLRRLARALRSPARDLDLPLERSKTLTDLGRRAPPALAARARELLAERPVRSDQALERLGAELLELEQRLLEGARGGSALPHRASAGEDAAPTATRT